MSSKKNGAKKEQFEKLAEQFSFSIIKTAMRLTRNEEETKDLAQETLMRGYEKYHLFDGLNFKAWILKLLTNIYINKYRKKQREAPTSAFEEQSLTEPTAPEEKMPDRQYLDKLIGPEIENALAKVPLDFRITVILSDIEGMSYEEVAIATETPIGTVRSRLARGRSILRQELENYAKNNGYL